MNTLFSTKHYTFHTGSGSLINLCNDIIFYCSRNKKLEPIIGVDPEGTRNQEMPEVPNIATLTETCQSLKASLGDSDNDLGSVCGRRSRVSVTDDFIIRESTVGTGIDISLVEFDVIIYCDNSGAPLGFTYFSDLQSNRKGSETEISGMKLSFHFSTITDEVEFSYSFSLDPIWAPDPPTPNDILRKRFYTYQKDVLQYYESEESAEAGRFNYMRWTDDIGQLDSIDNYHTLTDTAVLFGLEKGCNFWIPPRIPMEEYTHYNVGYWHGQIMVYRWDDLGNYVIEKASKCNHFGVMETEASGRVYLGESETISEFTDGICVIDGLDEYNKWHPRCGYVRLSDNRRYKNFKKRIINDPWDKNEQISVVDASKTATELGLRQLDPAPGDYFYLLRKHGPWYEFWNSGSSTQAWSSIYGTAYWQDSDIIIPFSDRILLRFGENIEFYEFNGGTEYVLGAQPGYKMLPNYCSDPIDNTEYTSPKELIDSIRRRPLPSVDLKFLWNSPRSLRGVLFYLDRETNEIRYL